ncbi:MAG: hypothetical protein R2845_14460 [Thermomicrobiales bacterium]
MIEAAYWAAVEEVDPLIAVLDTIDVFDGYALFDGTRVDIPAGVVVVAIGKAAVTMTQGARSRRSVTRSPRGSRLPKMVTAATHHSTGSRFTRRRIRFPTSVG